MGTYPTRLAVTKYFILYRHIWNPFPDSKGIEGIVARTENVDSGCWRQLVLSQNDATCTKAAYKDENRIHGFGEARKRPLVLIEY